ncbi:putative transcription factor C2H2 family [Helianthus annuus]|nr:putative transcription factor C2H2 family [Helianthus annuus]
MIEINALMMFYIFRWEMVNKVIFYMWWLIGFICVLSSYTNQGSAPVLFWLTMTFLAMDVFFAAIRFLFVCLLLVACCFCLPFIIAFLCYISREGPASEADIISLPKFKFKVSGGDVEQPDNRACRMIPVRNNGPDFSTERAIQIEDADCCICLCHYEEGEQLHLLPCNHHFHSTCIVKWLRVKASCPLCKGLVAPNE